MQARPFARLLSMLGFAGALGLSVAAQAAPKLPVAQDFDINRFAGGWFEIASMSTKPYAMRYNAIAAFAVNEQFPNTLQATFTSRSKVLLAEVEHTTSGVLAPADDRYPATLVFTWSRPPVSHTDFKVLAVADDYSWALVGDEARKNAYVYARSAEIDPQVLRSLIIRLDVDFDFVRPDRSMHCSLHHGSFVPGCAEILD